MLQGQRTVLTNTGSGKLAGFSAKVSSNHAQFCQQTYPGRRIRSPYTFVEDRIPQVQENGAVKGRKRYKTAKTDVNTSP